MKFHEPTKGKGMRKLFRKAGYQVYLVDEYHTSCQCYNCERRKKNSCETFRIIALETQKNDISSRVMGLSSVNLVQGYGIVM